MSKGPRRLTAETMSAGPGSEQPTVELRFINPNGDTEVWLIPKGTLDFEGLKARTRLAFLDHGVDLMLARQRESIDRLSKHVEHHHQGLQGVFPCGFGEAKDATTA